MLEIKEIVWAEGRGGKPVLLWLGKELPDEVTIEDAFGWRLSVQTTLHAEASSPDRPEHEIDEHEIDLSKVVEADVELAWSSSSESSIDCRRESGQRW